VERLGAFVPLIFFYLLTVFAFYQQAVEQLSKQKVAHDRQGKAVFTGEL